MPELMDLPLGLTAVIYTRGDRELDSLDPDERDRLDAHLESDE